MTDATDAPQSLHSVLEDEIIRMSEEVAENPEGEFHFFHGRGAEAGVGSPREERGATRP